MALLLASLGIMFATIGVCCSLVLSGVPHVSRSALLDSKSSATSEVQAIHQVGSPAQPTKLASPSTSASPARIVYRPPSWTSVWGVQCTYVSTIGTAQLWTPVILANAPHLGSTTVSSSVSSTGTFNANIAGFLVGSSSTTTRSWSTTISSGETGGLFELDTWTMLLYRNASIIGWGSPCEQNYVAEITATSNTVTTYNIQPSDSFYSQGPSSFTYAGYSSIIMDYYFSTNNYGSTSTCPGSAAVYTVSNSMSSWMGVEVSMSVTIGTIVSVQSSLLGFDMSLSGSVGTANTFTYNFPASGGTWFQDQLSVAGATGTSLAFWWVPCGWSGGSSGGCVASGTSVLTSTGWEAVQNIHSGNTVEGFNLTSGNTSSETVTSITHTTSNFLIKINGNLEITALDQPILIRNSTFFGVVHDPQNLTVGDQFLDPVAWLWVNITSLATIHTSTTVYDLMANGWFNWIVKAGGTSDAPMFDKWPE